MGESAKRGLLKAIPKDILEKAIKQYLLSKIAEYEMEIEEFEEKWEMSVDEAKRNVTAGVGKTREDHELYAAVQWILGAREGIKRFKDMLRDLRDFEGKH